MQGEVQLRQNKASDAVASYERAVAEAPASTVTVLQGLARALSQDGRYQVTLVYARMEGVQA